MAFADRLAASLRSRGFNALIDRSDIYAFEDWWLCIEELIVRSDGVVFVLSPAAMPGDLRKGNRAGGFAEQAPGADCLASRRRTSGAGTAAAAEFHLFRWSRRFRGAAQQSGGCALNQYRLGAQTYRIWRGCAAVVRSGTSRSTRAASAPAGAGGGRALDRIRPAGAPAPTEETEQFVAESRRAATQRRNIVTAGLGVGLALALGLAGAPTGSAGWRSNNGRLLERTRGGRKSSVIALC